MQHFLSYIESRLKTIYSKNEIKSIARLLLKQTTGMTSIQFFTDKDTKFPEEVVYKLQTSVERLFNGEPIQYILGETIFFNLKFNVKPGVLIPRPETEELVELVLKDYKNKNVPVNLLDIGTGSGCIAISLAKNLPQALVSAWDISPEALDIARDNAKINNVNIDFYLQDIRDTEHLQQEEKWDIIVSNPPYVCMSEKAEMETHVLNHEPHLALFVEDNDPLVFYRVIAQYAARNLNKGGSLYFEINSNFGEDTISIIQKCHFAKTDLLKDISGKDRMIRAVL